MHSTVSIIICTRNKAESLRETLRSVSAVNLPAGLSAEVIVADNGSTDQTPAVASEFAESQQKFSVRHLSVPTPGQSRARNAGIAVANGEIILFTDDDVRPPANWIEGMCRPILNGDADATTGSAKIPLHLERPWLVAGYRAALACPIPLPRTSPLPAASPLLGANMAFARHVLSRVPAFDERLGPGALGFADDDLFGLQLGEAGLRKLAVVGCEPEHHFDPSRLSREALLRRAAAQGRCEAYLLHHWFHGGMSHSRIRSLKRWMRLQYTRAMRRGEWRHADGAPEWEYQLTTDIHRYRQYLRERVHPRRYATPRGLFVTDEGGSLPGRAAEGRSGAPANARNTVGRVS